MIQLKQKQSVLQSLRNQWSSQGQQLWGFGKRPYDRIHSAGQELSEGEFVWSFTTDLFGWATAGIENNAAGYGADSHHTSYLPWSYSTDAGSYGPGETVLPYETSWTGNEAAEAYCEWGRNSALISLLGEGWRTLSRQEKYRNGVTQTRCKSVHLLIMVAVVAHLSMSMVRSLVSRQAHLPMDRKPT